MGLNLLRFILAWLGRCLNTSAIRKPHKNKGVTSGNEQACLVTTRQRDQVSCGRSCTQLTLIDINWQWPLSIYSTTVFPGMTSNNTLQKASKFGNFPNKCLYAHHLIRIEFQFQIHTSSYKTVLCPFYCGTLLWLQERRPTASTFSSVVAVLDRQNADWTNAHKHCNLFQNWTTIMESVMSIEKAYYLQLPLGAQGRFLKNIFTSNSHYALDQNPVKTEDCMPRAKQWDQGNSFSLTTALHCNTRLN